MIRRGSIVVAMRDGGHDAMGRPWQRPRKGTAYRVRSVYRMRYGLGCTLEGMDHRPFRGYLLYVARPFGDAETGWYFKEVEKADDEFTDYCKDLLRRGVPSSHEGLLGTSRRRKEPSHAQPLAQP